VIFAISSRYFLVYPNFGGNTAIRFKFQAMQTRGHIHQVGDGISSVLGCQTPARRLLSLNFGLEDEACRLVIRTDDYEPLANMHRKNV
jgi:hypothetical protein